MDILASSPGTSRSSSPPKPSLTRISPESCSRPGSHRAITFPCQTCQLDLLTPSQTETHSPYKGTATYWHLDVNGYHYDDFVWIYRAPLPESQKTRLGRVLNEKIDLYVDGVLQNGREPSSVKGCVTPEPARSRRSLYRSGPRAQCAQDLVRLNSEGRRK